MSATRAATAPSSATELKTIVVGTDFSEASRQALSAAADLAAAHGATLVIVHAIDPLVTTLDIPAATIIDDAKAGLEHDAKLIADRKVKTTTQTRMGKPWWAINEAAKDANADLVVVASHGRTGLARIALGSTADRVLRSCLSPVLMIPARKASPSQAVSPAQWKSCVVGVDFSEESVLATKMAMRLLAKSKVTHCTLLLFHTVALTIEFRGPDSPVALPQHWEVAEAGAKTQLEALAAPFRSDKIEVKTITFRGYPSDGLLHKARTQKVDFIALGTHGRGTVNRMLLGSVAERVLHHAECPVLTVRHPEAR